MTATALAPLPILPLPPAPVPRKRFSWYDLPENSPVPASLNRYIELVAASSQRLEYHEGKIIAMGEATVTHERLMANIVTLLNNVFFDDPKFFVMGSNVKTYVMGSDTPCFYNADVVAVRGEEPYLIEVQGEKRVQRGLANPWLVVEVLSKGTERYDLYEKIPNFKRIKTLQHIIVADHRQVRASLHSRIPGTEKWVSEDFYSLSDVVHIEGRDLRLSDFYMRFALEDDMWTVLQTKIAAG